MTNLKESCHHCNALPYLRHFATMLQQTQLNQIKGPNAPLRSDNVYSTTGLASHLLTPAIWINDGQNWRYHNINQFPEDIYKAFIVKDGQTGKFLSEYHLNQENYATLANQLGYGEVNQCPEKTLCALGIEHDIPTDRLQYLDQRRNLRNLDETDFKAAGDMLSSNLQLFSHCTCSP